jgi:branched-chain amino acid transport system permease protein
MLLSAMFLMLLIAISGVWSTTAQAAQSVQVCNPTGTNGCVNGILQDANKQPIAGATVTLSGTESATATTDDTGKWASSGSSSSSSASTQSSSSNSSGSNFGARVWQQLYSGIIFGLMLG